MLGKSSQNSRKLFQLANGPRSCKRVIAIMLAWGRVLNRKRQIQFHMFDPKKCQLALEVSQVSSNLLNL